MLTVPSVKKKRFSSKKFQDIMKKKEKEKKELKNVKEEHKRECIANAEEKKRCQEEAKKK